MIHMDHSCLQEEVKARNEAESLKVIMQVEEHAALTQQRTLSGGLVMTHAGVSLEINSSGSWATMTRDVAMPPPLDSLLPGRSCSRKTSELSKRSSEINQCGAKGGPYQKAAALSRQQGRSCSNRKRKTSKADQQIIYSLRLDELRILTMSRKRLLRQKKS